MTTGWIGVDLDGTLAHYDGWHGELHIGQPVMPMIEKVKTWIAGGLEVRIVTARVSGDREEAEAVRKAIATWCLEHIGCVLEVTHTKDYAMLVLYDDRAVQIVRNTGLTLDEWIQTQHPVRLPRFRDAAMRNDEH